MTHNYFIFSTKLKHPRNDGLWLIVPHNDVLSYSQMEIPASSLINRYIACQGPLPNTCPDFWQMTWEQGSSLVVMLTTQVERGRVCISLWHCNCDGFILTKGLLSIYFFFILLELTSFDSFLPQVKCHQYWPNPSGSATYGGFQVSCQTEEGNSAFLVRDMTLTHIEVSCIKDLHVNCLSIFLTWNM